MHKVLYFPLYFHSRGGQTKCMLICCTVLEFEIHWPLGRCRGVYYIHIYTFFRGRGGGEGGDDKCDRIVTKFFR